MLCYFSETLHVTTPSNRQLNVSSHEKTNIALPTTDHNLQPRTVKNVQSHLYNKRLIQKRYHDKTAKPLTDLTTNQSVRLQTEKGHEKIGFVKNPTDKPRSYIVNVQGREQKPSGVAPPCNQLLPRSTPETTPDTSYADVFRKPLPRERMMTSENPTTATEQSISSPVAVKTRSGRLVKPPSRYTV